MLNNKNSSILSIFMVILSYLIYQKTSIYLDNQVDYFHYKSTSAKMYPNSLKMQSNVANTHTHTLGVFSIQTTRRPPKIQVTQTLKLVTKVLWETVDGEAYLMTATGVDHISEWSGNYKIHSQFDEFCNNQLIDKIEISGDKFLISGNIGCPRKAKQCRCDGQFETQMSLVNDGIDSKNSSKPHLQLQTKFNPRDKGVTESNWRLFLKYSTNEDEKFFGFGHQFTGMNMRHHKIAIMTREQGLGRGIQPLTAMVNYLYHGAGGHATTSYGPAPHYVTNQGRSIYSTNQELLNFDLTKIDRVIVAIHSSLSINIRIIPGETMKELIGSYALQYSGVMKPLPRWANEEGICLGLEGTRKQVESLVETMVKDYKCPIASIWIQDWVGERELPWGMGLWWNWEWDDERYPDQTSFVSNLYMKYGIKTLGYVSLMYANVSKLGKPNFKRNLYQEAFDNDFLVKVECENGETGCDENNLKIWNGYEGAGMTDLTNPKAKIWLKEVIKTELINTGLRGWMADFGESLPWNAKLHSGEPGYRAHNIYPRLWAEVNQEAVHESGLENEIVYWMRASDAKTYSRSSLMWLGDQLASWDENDGLHSALIGLINSGLSGAQLQHSDIGAYNGVDRFPFHYIRSKELFMRWAEFAAFTSYYRTHYGTHPKKHWQFHSDHETRLHFTKFANIFKALAPYRHQLMENDMKVDGLPLNRPLFLEFQNDAKTFESKEQFMLGSDLLISPVLHSGYSTVRLYLPEGRWRRVLSHTGCTEEYDGSQWIILDTPLGYPGVLIRLASTYQPMLTAIFKEFDECK